MNIKSGIKNYPILVRTPLLIVATVFILELFFFFSLIVSSLMIGKPALVNIFPHPIVWRSFQVVEQVPSHHFRIWHPIYGWINEINTKKKGACRAGSTDRYGYRDNGNPHRTIDRSKKLIFWIGGSSAYGAGQSCEDKTTAAQLEKLLQKSVPGAQVINAGLSGYWSANEFLRVANEIIYYKPDLVISLTGVNDGQYHDRIYPELHGRPNTYGVSPYQRYLLESLKNTESPAHASRFLIGAIKKSAVVHFRNIEAAFYHWTYTGWFIKGLYNTFFKKPDKNKNYGDLTAFGDWYNGFGKNQLKKYKSASERFNDLQNNTFVWIDPNADYRQLYKKNSKQYQNFLQMTTDILTRHGTHHLIVLQPQLATEKRELHPTEAHAITKINETWKELGLNLVERRNYFMELTRNMLENSGLSWVDLSDVFPPKKQAYVTHYHYHDFGAKILAEAVAKTIFDRNLLEK